MKYEYPTKQQEPSGLWSHETNAYRRLLEIVNDIPHLTETERRALAFVIEDMSQTAPDRLEQDLQALEDALRQIKEQKGLPELTWKLAQEFTRRYDAFLAKLQSQEQDPTRQKNLNLLRESLARDLETLRQAHQEGRRVPIGSVISEHVPVWF